MTKAKVLIVEDDELLREVYAVKFDMEGYEVRVGRDGVEGLEIATQWQPHLILLDILMPRMTGLEFLAHFKPKERNTPVMVLSNRSTPEGINEARQLGASEYLIKSQYTPDEIAECVRGYLSRQPQSSKS